MTPKELQELRDWAARKMGFTEKDNNYMVPEEKLGHWRILFWQLDWKPDKDANQCFMLVERMRELGWQMQLWCMKRDFGNYAVVFYREYRDWRELKERDYTKDPNPCLAILKAARSTED